MDRLYVTGFDSAWGGAQRGAMCDLWIDKQTEALGIESAPVSVSWDEAIQRAGSYAKHSHHILAIDQGLIVPKNEGMRPVERSLAKALGSMDCSAYPSNRSNVSCYGPNAGIWKLLALLDRSGYIHRPLLIPRSKDGRYYFECYPHPAIIALFDRKKILKYKCRHKNQDDWKELVDGLKRLPVENLDGIIDSLSFQNKANEDKLDSIVCAYAAALWWLHGVKCSSMIGSMTTGYIVTPHSNATLERLTSVFKQEMNDDRGTTPPSLLGDGLGNARVLQTDEHAVQTEVVPTVLDDGSWAGPVELIATDTSNLSRTMRLKKGRPSKVINDWMEPTHFCCYRLTVKFLDEDSEPEVAFVPHSHSESQKTLMADEQGQPGLWFLLVAGASKKTPLSFRIKYKYQRFP
jgi:predicted RNase H-like nuclease